ncbi:MAG: ADP-glyceromanno-heptose 6-epimerase, partial [Planctomycetes bacterium]|nr:ADP-glyceromanno-heptose 6-epimerase [Planctomycetota bacterium]
VTGGAGFIGSNLTLELQSRHPDAEIVVLDDFSSGDWSTLKGFNGDVVTADMTKTDWMVSLSNQEFDQIYHLAANTDAREEDQAKMMRQNVDAFRLLLEFAAETETPIVYATSAATYVIRDGVMKESDQVDPFSVYAFSKCVMENVARIAQEKSGGDWKIVGVRYFNVFGPRETHKGVPASMIFHLSHQMLEGKRPRIFEFGEQSRDHVYVKDVVHGTICAMESEATRGVYNLGSGVASSFNDLVKSLNRVLGLDLEPEYFPNPFKLYQNHTEADISLSKEVIGYVPRFNLETGIEDYMRWLHPGKSAPPGVGGA